MDFHGAGYPGLLIIFKLLGGPGTWLGRLGVVWDSTALLLICVVVVLTN